MITAVVADLHLGTRTTVLARPEARSRLLAGLEGVDRLVLLGDVLHLRDGPVRRVLETARPFLTDLAQTLDGRPVVFVPGNHDHQLAAPILEEARLAGRSLGLETLMENGFDGPLSAVSDMMADARVAIAYPGLWIRPDLYATHGHYLDCHLKVPRAEVLLASVSQWFVGRIPADAKPADYEAVLAPVYSLAYDLAQAGRRNGAFPARPSGVFHALRGSAWRLFEGRGRRRDALLLATAIAGLNRLGLGSFTSDFSSDALNEATVAAIETVLARLKIDADYVVFGHTHRPGDWTLPTGTRLLNAGSWGVSPTPMHSPEPDPYRPGTLVVIGEGSPEVRGLLDDLPPGDLVAEVPDLASS